MTNNKKCTTRRSKKAVKSPRRPIQSKEERLQYGSTGGVQKKYRYRPGTKALQEIRRYQKSYGVLVPKAPMQRVIREIGEEFMRDLRFQAAAIGVLHVAAEAFLIEDFENGNLFAIHDNRTTINPIDLRLARRIRGGYQYI